MKKNYFLTILLTLGIVITTVSPYVLAAGPTTATTTTTSTSTTANQSAGFALDVHLQNPLKVDTIKDAVKFFVDTLIKIAIPFVVVFFIWAGLKFILAQGNPTKVAEAKKMFWYTIIGMLLIFGAWTITNAIIGTVNSITN